MCGPEAALAADVAASVRAGLPDAGQVTFFAGACAERDIWDACGVLPPSGQQRLVVVHDAQHLSRPGELTALARAGREAADSYLLFVSADSDFTRDGEGLAPHLAALRDSRRGQLIRCTAPHGDDLLDWVARQWPGLGRNAAHRLLERAAGDLAAVAAAGVKARRTGLLEEKHIPVLCEPPAGGEFAELLIRGDVAGALAAAADLPYALPAMLSLLAARLSLLEAVREGQRRQLGDRDICGRLGVPRFLLGRYRDAAQGYGPARVQRCRELLAEADAACRSGSVTGVAEVVAAGW